jgi:crotonobetainyl-CoA hydratase
VASETAFQVEKNGHILTATTDRPEALNAVNQAVSDGLGDALDLDDHDSEIRAMVITGAGDRAFCAQICIRRALTS